MAQACNEPDFTGNQSPQKPLTLRSNIVTHWGDSDNTRMSRTTLAPKSERWIVAGEKSLKCDSLATETSLLTALTWPGGLL